MFSVRCRSDILPMIKVGGVSARNGVSFLINMCGDGGVTTAEGWGRAHEVGRRPLAWGDYVSEGGWEPSRSRRRTK